MCLITILVTPPTTETFKFTFYAPCVAIPPCSIIHMILNEAHEHIIWPKAVINVEVVDLI